MIGRKRLCVFGWEKRLVRFGRLESEVLRRRTKNDG